jgi:hypothetical protein
VADPVENGSGVTDISSSCLEQKDRYKDRETASSAPGDNAVVTHEGNHPPIQQVIHSILELLLLNF